MSDDPIRLPGAASAASAGIYEHWCEHPGCTKWGGWGYSINKHTPPRWFCWEHRDDGEALLSGSTHLS